MTIPKDLGRPPRPDDEACLYRLPEEFRETFEAAVAAGYARSPEDFWYYEQRHPAPNQFVVRQLLRSVIEAVPADRSDTRTPENRLDDAVKAIFGKSAVEGTNAKNDDEVLERLAYDAETKQLAESELRGAIRSILSAPDSDGVPADSDVKRILRKFKKDRAKYDERARQGDIMPEHIERLALREISRLLHSVGVPTLLN